MHPISNNDVCDFDLQEGTDGQACKSFIKLYDVLDLYEFRIFNINKIDETQKTEHNEEIVFSPCSVNSNTHKSLICSTLNHLVEALLDYIFNVLIAP